MVYHDGQEYEMSHFDINFAQSVDHKGATAR